MPELTEKQEQISAESRWDFSDLSAIYIHCTLKRSPELSHTRTLADRSIAVMEHHGVSVEVIRAVDHDIATGIWPDMTEHGWERDDWPAIFEQVMAADILVLLSPIWLGQKSSICMQVIERLYGNSHRSFRVGRISAPGRGACFSSRSRALTRRGRLLLSRCGARRRGGDAEVAGRQARGQDCVARAGKATARERELHRRRRRTIAPWARTDHPGHPVA